MAMGGMLFALTACQTSKDISSSKTITMEIAPELTTCHTWYSPNPVSCMQVREVPGDSGYESLSPSGIQGFEYEPGYLWTLKVKKEKLKNPPADAGDTRYILKKVISRKRMNP